MSNSPSAEELIRIQEIRNRELDSDALFSYADNLLEPNREQSVGVSSPSRMSIKVQQAARASQERRDSRREGETPPSSSNVDSFPVSGRPSTGSRASGHIESILPNPPSPSRNSIHVEVSSPPRSIPQLNGTPSPSVVSSNGAEMGEEGTTRFLKAKLTVLQQQVTHHNEISLDLKQRLSESEALRKELTDEMKRLRRNEGSISDRQQKEVRARESAEAEAERLRSEVTKWRQEAEAARRGARSAESETKTRDVRLQRALDDAKKYKDMLTEERGSRADEMAGLRKEVSKLENRASKLEKQKAEVLAAFKKQMKLIDVLKRQKVHIEAARAIAFSEEEFMKTLDWGN